MIKSIHGREYIQWRIYTNMFIWLGVYIIENIDNVKYILIYSYNWRYTHGKEYTQWKIYCSINGLITQY